MQAAFGSRLRVGQRWLVLFLPIWQLICLAVGLAGEPPVDFAEQIVPILRQHCLRCHYPGNEKGDISLATFEDLAENEYVIAGAPDSSYLIELISSVDGQRPQMPKEGEPLSDEQVALIRQWIAQGAHWPESVVIRNETQADENWWAFQPLREVVPPQPDGIPSTWRDNPIDRFVYAQLARHGLRPNPPADRRTLIRRATFDLTGLPPTPDEVEAFVHDPDPHAYERLIDRLLASPRYGERWGRHWLDVVRFGESNGYERNVIINDLWPFRDYVIRSFNEDKPFDQFIREHLAGDVIGGDNPNQVIGSAFLVAGPYDDVGNQDAVQAAIIRANTIDEMIRATGEAFLGMTIGCARCHDHKFDPITQEDYYAWYATFAAVRHGRQVVASEAERAERTKRLQPLEQRLAELKNQRQAIVHAIQQRGRQRAEKHERQWVRPPPSRTGTEEVFPPVTARFVRLISEASDVDPADSRNFTIDEFEVWSAGSHPRNVALASSGAKASGPSRRVEDFPGAYGPQLAIDGKTGARFIGTAGVLTIELAEPTAINRVSFSSARGEAAPQHPIHRFVAEYRIEVSQDGKRWIVVADSHDRQPVNNAHRDKRLFDAEISEQERTELTRLDEEIGNVERQIAAVPPLPMVWVGTRDEAAAKGPFHVLLGGDPQRKGSVVVPQSLSALANVTPGYQLSADSPEAARRVALAEWIVHTDNPLTPRVLVNRLWHYHFGTGIVDTPSDFGYMGGRPTHPELLDWLALQVHRYGWRLKPMHKLIVLSQTYRQSSTYRPDAAKVDANARLLWRFPPRRLEAEEVRDAMLAVSGVLNTRMGGPGFRLYRYLQDNVSTYVPLDQHGPETYRRAVYHQNARASVIDLLTDFDQPDCAFATPRRAQTTTPLQALTLLNHSFTLDMARYLSQRLTHEAGPETEGRVRRAFLLCYAREPDAEELATCCHFVDQHGWEPFCRVLLNTSEMIYVR